MLEVLKDLFLVHSFLIHINDLSDDLPSNAKLFAENTSLFLVKFDFNAFRNELACDLNKINDCVFQRKMSFNFYCSKKAPNIILRRKVKKAAHPPLVFN